MAATAGSRVAAPALAHRFCQQPPIFLAPALAEIKAYQQSVSRFSTSTPHLNRDGNKMRGVSALRRKYPKHPLSVSKEPLPKPVLDPKKRTKLKAEADHGLWGFFPPSRVALMTPEEMAQHGRAWSMEELRGKGWEDLHSLWWVCCKEKNMIATQEWERQRLNAGYGEIEAQDRLRVVSRTQRAIKQVLTERWYAYEAAQRLREEQPELIDPEAQWEEISEDDIAAAQNATALPPSEGGPAIPPNEAQSKPEKVHV